jgi:hypothetical protein
MGGEHARYCDDLTAANLRIAELEAERDAFKRPVCDIPGCGLPIPVGGEGHPEICPRCLATEKIEDLARQLWEAQGQRDTAYMNLARVEGERDAMKRCIGGECDEGCPYCEPLVADEVGDANDARDAALREVAAWKAKAETAWEKLDRAAEERIAKHADLAALRERLGEATRLLRDWRKWYCHDSDVMPVPNDDTRLWLARLDAETSASPSPVPSPGGPPTQIHREQVATSDAVRADVPVPAPGVSGVRSPAPDYFNATPAPSATPGDARECRDCFATPREHDNFKRCESCSVDLCGDCFDSGHADHRSATPGEAPAKKESK